MDKYQDEDVGLWRTRQMEDLARASVHENPLGSSTSLF
jgi:hypothetical protein